MSNALSYPAPPRGKVTYAQAALIGVIAVTASKFCTLPSVLAGVAESKAIWSALILAMIELALLACSLAVAKRGGLPALPLSKGARVPLLLFFFAFFALKLTALSREVATYFALSLFENVAVLPILILLLATCALVAAKGGAAIGRMAEILVWLFLFVLIFVLVFTRTEGDLFNALGMVSPDLKGLGAGVWKGAGWFGDGAILALLDLSGEKAVSPQKKKSHHRIAFASLASILLVTAFYALFLSAYGDAAKMTDYAFVKLSAFKANTDELGSADWPVIILWSVISCLYLALLFLSGEACFVGLTGKAASGKGRVLPYLLLGGSATVLSALFLGEKGAYTEYMTRGMNVVTAIAAAGMIGVGVYAMTQKKGGKNEE